MRTRSSIFGCAGRGSTRFVDFHTTKPIYSADKCHLNAMAADTKQWEQSAAFALDTHSNVVRWVKNEHLGLRVPYRKHEVPANYLPDFIAALNLDHMGDHMGELILLIEIKGQYGDDADLKALAVEMIERYKALERRRRNVSAFDRPH